MYFFARVWSPNIQTIIQIQFTKATTIIKIIINSKIAYSVIGKLL